MSINLYFSLRDEVSPELQKILKNTKTAKDAMDEMGKAVAKTEDRMSDFGIEMSGVSKKVQEAKKAWQQAENALGSLSDEADENTRKLQENETAAARLNYKNAIKEQQKLRSEFKQTSKILDGQRGDLEKLTDAASKSNNRFSAIFSGSKSGGNPLSTLGKAGIAGAVGSIMSEGLQAQASAWFTSNMSGRDAKMAGSTVGGALSGATTGAAVGSIFGPVGTLVGGLGGAALGGVSGWLSGNAQEKEEFEEYRKSKVQDTFSTVLSDYQENSEAGQALAQSREQIKLSLKTLLKDEQAANQLFDDMKTYAMATQYTVDELAGTTRLLSVGFKDTDDILNWMTNLSDAAAVIGMDESDMQEMTRALTKTKNLGKATREFLDMFSDRGVDVYGYLSETLKVSQEGLFEKIRKGEVSASTVLKSLDAGIKKDYGGGAYKVGEETFAGKLNTLAGLKDDVFKNSYGEAYNETRLDSINEQIEFLQGEYGEKISKLMEIMGKWDAELENKKDQLEMDNWKAWVDGIDNVPEGMKESFEVIQNVFSIFPKEIGEPLSATVGGISEGLGNINASAANLNLQKGTAELLDFSNQLIGINTTFKEQSEELFGYIGQLNGGDVYASYAAMMGKSQIDFFNSSQYQEHNMKNKDALYGINKELADPNTVENLKGTLERVMGDGLEGADAALERWDGPEILRQKFSNLNLGINITPTIRSSASTVNSVLSQTTSIVKSILPFGKGHASGLTRVPYDNYPALLHQGERVLTAQEVRQGERSSGGVTVTITGNTFTGSSPADARSIAEQVAAEVARKLLQASRIT